MITIQGQHYCSTYLKALEGRSIEPSHIEPIVAPDEAFQIISIWETNI